MILNDLGKYCNEEIERLSTRQTVDVHEYIVMPNHIHILLVISEYTSVGVDHQSTLENKLIKGDLSNHRYQPIVGMYGNTSYTNPDLFERHVATCPYSHPLFSSKKNLPREITLDNLIYFCRRRW